MQIDICNFPSLYKFLPPLVFFSLKNSLSCTLFACSSSAYFFSSFCYRGKLKSDFSLFTARRFHSYSYDNNENIVDKKDEMHNNTNRVGKMASRWCSCCSVYFHAYLFVIFPSSVFNQHFRCFRAIVCVLWMEFSFHALKLKFYENNWKLHLYLVELLMIYLVCCIFYDFHKEFSHRSIRINPQKK